jgi:hypothetical protein
MADDNEARFRQHEAMLEGLARLFAVQHDFNQRVTLAIERIDQSIARIDQTLAHVEITQARIETLLARMLRPGDNGQGA